MKISHEWQTQSLYKRINFAISTTKLEFVAELEMACKGNKSKKNPRIQRDNVESLWKWENVEQQNREEPNKKEFHNICVSWPSSKVAPFEAEWRDMVLRNTSGKKGRKECVRERKVSWSSQA